MPTMPKTHDSMAKRPRRQRAKQGEAYLGSWRRVRVAVLTAEPVCRYCAERGRTTLATVVDHVIPYTVRPELRLVRSNLQPLCVPCHSSVKQREEAQGTR